MRPLASVLVPAATLLAAACGSDGGGGGGGGGPVQPAQAVLFVMDAPTDDLLRLEGSINSLVLFDDLGGSTSNLLASAPYPVNLVSLGLSAVPVASVELPPGRYVSAFLSLSAPTLSARTKDPLLGEVPITALPAVSASFLSPLDLASGDVAGVVLDVDLVRSAIFDVGTGSIVFLPNQRPQSLAAGAPVETFEGIVRRIRKSQNLFEVDVVPLDGGTAPLGSLEVVVDGADLLVGPAGTPFPNLSSFFNALDLGDRIAASGAWNATGFVDASTVRIETGSGTVVELEGRVLFLNPPLQTLFLQIATVRTGKAIVDAALPPPPNDPGALNVGWSGLTSFLLLDPPGTTTASALRVGHEVRVRFDAFNVSGPPFTVTDPASAFEILDSGELFEGVVTDVASLPASVEVALDPTDPHVLGLLVAAPLPAELGALASLRVHVGSGPPIAVSDLQVDQRVRFSGTLTGVSPTQTIVASSGEVLPGRISDSTVTSVNPTTSRFTCTFDTLAEPLDPFGGAPPASPAEVEIQPGALLLGPLGNPIGLMEFQNLSAQFGPDLHADFQGIGTPAGTILRAFDVRLTVR